MTAKHLVLVGAGHAHLAVIRGIARLTADGHHVTVIAPGPFWYSGMVPGHIQGRYAAAEVSHDVEPTVVAAGGVYLEDCVTRIDIHRKRLLMASGREVAFDLLSLNVGSEVPLEEIEGANALALPVKPLATFAKAVTARLAADDAPLSITLCGGGIAATELALNIAAASRDRRHPAEVTIAASTFLKQLPPRAQRIAAETLRDASVRLRVDSKVARVEADHVVNEAGDRWPCDLCIGAIGIRPPRLMAESGLRTSDSGEMIVDRHLRSVSHPFVLGAGDCIRPEASAIDKVGVYAVREAPVLLDNLRATLDGKPLKVFEPQRKYLLIADLGDGRGLLIWRGVVVASRLSLWFKTWLDRRFMREQTTSNVSATSRRLKAAAAAFAIGLGGLLLWHPVAEVVSRPTWPRVEAMIAQTYPSVPSVSTADLAEALEAGGALTLVDVREPDEFAVSRLAGATRVDPFTPPDPRLLTLLREARIVAYCSVGYRSADYVGRLRALGFSNAVNLKGSIFAWANEGRPLVNDRGPTTMVDPYDASWGRLLDPAHRASSASTPP